MSVRTQRVEPLAKKLEVARFVPETLALATNRRNSFVCGWGIRPRVDRNTHIIIEVNFGNGYRVVGDGWVRSSPVENEEHFGKDFPHIAPLDDVRIIIDPENFLDSPLAQSWPARSVSIDENGQTFINAARTTVALDYLWAEGLTGDVTVIQDWEFD